MEKGLTLCYIIFSFLSSKTICFYVPLGKIVDIFDTGTHQAEIVCGWFNQLHHLVTTLKFFLHLNNVVF